MCVFEHVVRNGAAFGAATRFGFHTYVCHSVLCFEFDGCCWSNTRSNRRPSESAESNNRISVSHRLRPELLGALAGISVAASIAAQTWCTRLSPPPPSLGMRHQTLATFPAGRYDLRLGAGER